MDVKQKHHKLQVNKIIYKCGGRRVRERGGEFAAAARFEKY